MKRLLDGASCVTAIASSGQTFKTQNEMTNSNRSDSLNRGRKRT
jgi:hypothetical protein